MPPKKKKKLKKKKTKTDKELKKLCQFYEDHPNAGKVVIDEEILAYNPNVKLATRIKGVWNHDPNGVKNGMT
jgi:hypothetical protein